MERRVLPVGMQDFENIRKGDYLYVDKTEYIWNLVNSSKSFLPILSSTFCLNLQGFS